MPIWKDIDQKFLANPVTEDVTVLTDKDAIKQSIKNLILSTPTDHKFHPEIYCIAGNYLFSNMNSTDKQIIIRDIINILSVYEPRIEIYDVDVEKDENARAISIKISYYYARTDETDLVNVIVKEIR
nr:MAG TPA: Baseplate wedge protein [Caudoviricetes sp.]